MAERDRQHIILRRRATAERYRRPPQAIPAGTLPTPGDRGRHGHDLVTALQDVQAQGTARRPDDKPLANQRGIFVEIESFPGIELSVTKLDSQVGRVHPELRGVKQVAVNGTMVERAVVWIPDGKTGYFVRKLEKYLATADADKPANADLVDRINRITLATLEAFWTDPPGSFPEGPDRVWWEIWLRRDAGSELERLKVFAEREDLQLGPWYLAFADRSVALIEASPVQLARAIDLLDDLAEVRHPNPFVEQLAVEPPADQAEWVADLVARTTPADRDAPVVSILDSGVLREHPLLVHSLDDVDCHTCDPAWGTHDDRGHGTEMAGLALYGRLSEPMLATGPVRLTHRLESVKLLSRTHETPRSLWGAMTATAASLVEIQAPGRSRVFSVAVSADPSAPVAPGPQVGVGQPTAWSAAVDALAAGQSVTTSDDGLVTLESADADFRRLFVLAAGNVVDFDDGLGDDFLARCDLRAIEDPGQAWNALTVGAMTDLDAVAPDDRTFAGWTALAPRGELSPHSRTSVIHDRAWPAKPDVVMEGGNLGRSPAGTFDTPDSLQILTTRRLTNDARLLTVTGQTSAATAQAGHLAASIMSRYPELWPETVRALIVHSAEWTDAMRRHLGANPSRAEVDLLRRRYGMGVPDLSRATRSATDALTLVAEDVIRPYAEGTMREMTLHRLPWPGEELAALGEARVRMRVTLSYFIEPNPARRGWAGRFTYQSHGLRFDLRRATESDADFRGRVNELARTEGWTRDAAATDADEWLLGPKSRVAGSVFSDVWTGSAADLARRGVVAIYPVGGWWKERPRLDRSEAGARYALIVSIETPDQTIDLWTPVAIQTGLAIEIET